MPEYLSKEELEDYFGREYLTIYEMFGFGPDDYIQHYYRDEIWTRIIGWEEYYWISNKGRVWSVRSQRILKHSKNNNNGRYHDGHFYVSLYDDNHKPYKGLIHRLLGIHFIPNPNDYPIVGHINDHRENNCLENLEWCTYSENLYNAYENRCRKKIYGPFISINIDTNEKRYFTHMSSICEYLNLRRDGNVYRSINTGGMVQGHRVFDANEFDLPPGLQDGDIVELEVLHIEN